MTKKEATAFVEKLHEMMRAVIDAEVDRRDSGWADWKAVEKLKSSLVDLVVGTASDATFR